MELQKLNELHTRDPSMLSKREKKRLKLSRKKNKLLTNEIPAHFGGSEIDNTISFKDLETNEPVSISSQKKTITFGPMPKPKDAAAAANEHKGPSQELKLLRKSLGIRVRGCDCPPPIPIDDAIGALPPDFGFDKLKGKFRKPTTIQQQLWPAALAGLDLVAIAPTGCGKTLGYLLPGIAHIKKRPSAAVQPGGAASPLMLVMVPTRELAMQVNRTRIFPRTFLFL